MPLFLLFSGNSGPMGFILLILYVKAWKHHASLGILATGSWDQLIGQLCSPSGRTFQMSCKEAKSKAPPVLWELIFSHALSWGCPFVPWLVWLDSPGCWLCPALQGAPTGAAGLQSTASKSHLKWQCWSPTTPWQTPYWGLKDKSSSSAWIRQIFLNNKDQSTSPSFGSTCWKKGVFLKSWNERSAYEDRAPICSSTGRRKTKLVLQASSIYLTSWSLLWSSCGS